MILNSRCESFSKTGMFLGAFQKLPQNVEQKGYPFPSLSLWFFHPFPKRRACSQAANLQKLIVYWNQPLVTGCPLGSSLVYLSYPRLHCSLRQCKPQAALFLTSFHILWASLTVKTFYFNNIIIFLVYDFLFLKINGNIVE